MFEEGQAIAQDESMIHPRGTLSPSSDKERTPQEILKDHEVRIQFLDSGCIIRVGCKSFAFSTVDGGIGALNAYVKDPKREISFWLNKIQK